VRIVPWLSGQFSPSFPPVITGCLYLGWKPGIAVLIEPEMRILEHHENMVN
jgi:hypothetical protein